MTLGLFSSRRVLLLCAFLLWATGGVPETGISGVAAVNTVASHHSIRPPPSTPAFGDSSAPESRGVGTKVLQQRSFGSPGPEVHILQKRKEGDAVDSASMAGSGLESGQAKVVHTRQKVEFKAQNNVGSIDQSLAGTGWEDPNDLNDEDLEVEGSDLEPFKDILIEPDLLDKRGRKKKVKKSVKKRSFSGRGTYYRPDQGNCGWYNDSSDLVVALSTAQYGGGEHCGKWLKACYDGRCVKAQVVDSCPGCSWGSLDMSPRAFKTLAPLSKGVIQISWDWA